MSEEPHVEYGQAGPGNLDFYYDRDELQRQSMSSLFPPLTKTEYALRRDQFGENCKVVTQKGELSRAYYGHRKFGLDTVEISEQKVRDIESQYAPPDLLPQARNQAKPKKFDIPQDGLHGNLGTGNTVVDGVAKNGLTAEERKWISILFEHHLHHYMTNDEERATAKVVERQFRSAIGRSPTKPTFFANQVTADQIVKRVAVNFRKKGAAERRSGKFGDTEFARSSSGKEAVRELVAAATWTNLLERPFANDLASLPRSTDGSDLLDGKVDGRHAYDCGPKCFCIKSWDGAFKPRQANGKSNPITNKKISGTVAMPHGTGVGVEQYVFDLEKMANTLRGAESGARGRHGLKKELLRIKLKKLQNEVSGAIQSGNQGGWQK